MSPYPDGALVIDKPVGPTSHDVVAVARRALRTRRIGHTGTLDPVATGVLVLLIGRATRLARFLASDRKEYVAEVRLGVETDSWDREGRIVRTTPAESAWPPRARVDACLRALTGQRNQVPPPFSAKRVDGTRAYDLARRGKAVELNAVPVVLHEAVVLGYTPPGIALRLVCPSGFYVRSLARELGRALECGGTLHALQRTASGAFTIEGAISLQELAAAAEPASLPIVPVDAMLPHLPAIELRPSGLRKATHGNDVGPTDIASPPSADAEWRTVRMVSATGELVAVGQETGEQGILHPLVVLK